MKNVDNMSPAFRYFLITMGWLSFILGIIGLFLPIVPTAPFIIIAAACFSKSSKHFHHWLMNHVLFGPMLKAWEEGKGMPKIARRIALASMWAGITGTSIIGTTLLLWDPWFFIPVLGIGGISVTIYLLKQPVY